jgi:orotidine-5'-phosphate decarboxylase
MGGRNFNELLNAQWDKSNFLCVGLDPDYEKIPASIKTSNVGETILAFNRAIVDATKKHVCAYKPNSAFYEAHGEQGWIALRETISYIHMQAPEIPIILDAKRADIGNTNNGYITAIFTDLNADAVTVHPYQGGEALAPFLNLSDKGIIVWCRSSNSGAGEFQDLMSNDEPLYIHVARNVANTWNTHSNCGLVVGATYPEEIKAIRAVAPDLPFLIPGIGTQGGDLERTITYGKDNNNRGMIISVSRAITYASATADFAEAAAQKAKEFDSAIRTAL